MGIQNPNSLKGLIIYIDEFYWCSCSISLLWMSKYYLSWKMFKRYFATFSVFSDYWNIVGKVFIRIIWFNYLFIFLFSFIQAVSHYSRAIELKPTDHVILGNRSAAYIRLVLSVYYFHCVPDRGVCINKVYAYVYTFCFSLSPLPHFN